MRIEQFEFANADIAGNASGTYRTAGQGPGEVDIVAQASRLDAGADPPLPAAHRRSMHPRVAAHGARRGEVSDARLKFAGNLAEFPFANGKGGQLLVTAKAKGGTLAYAAGLATPSRRSTPTSESKGRE